MNRYAAYDDSPDALKERLEDDYEKEEEELKKITGTILFDIARGNGHCDETAEKTVVYLVKQYKLTRLQELCLRGDFQKYCDQWIKNTEQDYE